MGQFFQNNSGNHQLSSVLVPDKGALVHPNQSIGEDMMGDELELSLDVRNSQIHIGRQSKVSLKDRMMADGNSKELFLEFQPHNGSNSFHGLTAAKSPQNNKSTPYFLEKNVNLNNFGGLVGAAAGEDESKSVFTRSDNGY